MRKIFHSFTSAITFSYLLFFNNPGLAETAPTNIIAPEEIAETISQAQPDSTNLVGQVTSVSQLADVQPTDWAFGALQSLVERYGVIAGYPNRTFRGNRGALAGIAAGQPFIVSEIGNTTQTNFEAFYNFPVSNNIQVTPLIQVITNASNQEANGTIVTGTLRTVFSF